MLHVSHRTTPCKRVDLLTLLHFRDNVAARTLTFVGYTDTKNMTVDNCVNFCNTQNFVYAGVEYGQECCKWCFNVPRSPIFFPISAILITRSGILDCGNVISNGGTTALDSDCSFPCNGNANETCGAGGRLNLYWSGAVPPAAPVIAPNNGLWISLGCYKYIHLPFLVKSGSLTLLCLSH